MKQTCKVLLIFIFALSFFCILQNIEGYAVSDYDISNNNDGTVTITGYNGTAKDIKIPSTIGGKTVTGIGDSAFYNKSLTSVTIPDSVTTIGGRAFWLNCLTSVTIPSNVTSTLFEAFAKNNISIVEVKSKDTNINLSAFSQQYQRSSCDWYLAPDFSGEKFDFSAQRDDNITLYLYDKCIVTYDTNGADAEVPSDKTAKINFKLTKPINPTKTGYIFIGWFKENRLIYEWDFSTYVVTDDITLYAGWISNPETLTDDDVEVVGGEIVKYFGSKTNIIIPSTLDGQTVTSIGDNAFKEKNLTGVMIPGSVKRIGKYAFYFNSLRSVTISNGVEEIGERAFLGGKFKSLTIPDSVKSIGIRAFETNQFKSITIPNGIERIEEGTFIGNSSLTSVTIPNSVTSIGVDAFAMTRLTNITIPNSVINIEDKAFTQGTLTSVIIPNSVKNIGQDAFRSNKLITAKIESKDTMIHPTAFGYQNLPNNQKTSDWYENPDLSGSKFDSWRQGTRDDKVTIYSYVENKNHTVTFNTNGADSGALPSIKVENNKTILKPENPSKTGYSFDGWYKDSELKTEWDFSADVVTEDITLYAKWVDPRILTDDEVVVTEGVITSYTGTKTDIIIPSTLDGQTVTGIGNEVFIRKELTNITIPDSVETIGTSAFQENKLESVIIPDGVKIIGDCAFLKNNLTNLTIGNKVTSIGVSAFQGESVSSLEGNILTSIVIPDSVKIIGDFAFKGNELTSITIGNGVTKIGNQAFIFNSLTNVTIPSNVESIGNYAFQSNKLTSLIIDNGVKSIGIGTFLQNELINIAIPNSVESLGNSAFESNELASITIGSGVTSIGERSFINNKLKNVTIPNSVESIGASAFEYNKLESVIIPNSVKNIGQSAFKGNKDSEYNQITSVTIPNSVTKIGDDAFSYNKLTSLTIENGITRIGDYVFRHNKLTNITIPDSVETIGVSAFAYNLLESVMIPDGVTDIQESAFKGNKLTDVIISNSVESIKESVFEDNSLTGVTIPDSVTSIRESAFKGNKLTSITIGNGVKSIGSSAFQGNEELNSTQEGNQITSLTIPDSVESIGNTAFAFNKLKSVTIPKNVKVISGFAFFQNHLTSVTIKSANTEIDQYAFECNDSGIVPEGYKSQILPNGFEFKGWFKSLELTDDSKFDSWGQGTRTGDLTIYSYSEIKQHTVSFNTNGADSIAPSDITVENNNKISKPENPTKTGYSFDGWYIDSGLKTEWDFTTDVVKGDITLYAKWTANPKVDTPTVSPDGRNFTNSLQAVLICNTIDSYIHFTLDGSEPTTESEVYTSPININQTTTLKALATAQGYLNSDILTVTYTKKSSSSSSNNNNVKGKADDSSFNVGTKKIKRNSKGEKEIIVTTKESAIKKQVDKISKNSEITIPVIGKANKAKLELNVQSIKDMQDKNIILEIETNEAIYNLTTNKINIENISNEIGVKVELKDIKFTVNISKTNKEMVKIVEDSATGKGLSIVVPPVDFEIEASYENKTYKVKKFKGFVSRKIEIPEGVDESKITTAIVIEKDGSIRHVPTFITIMDGKYYAEINSLTNSTYSLIYNEEFFRDVTDDHWGKKDIEKMASRIIVEGKEDGTFGPDESITRGELAKAIVRALGLRPIAIDKFDDIDSDSEIAGYIGTAYSYGIIKGINEDTFNADGIVTRQDAMTMIYRASIIADFNDKNDTKDPSSFIDYIKVSDYAKEAVDWNVNNNIIIGKTDNTIVPFDNITRAELCAIINRFLISAKLID